MKKYFDLVANVGEYQKDGETKKRYQNCGMMMAEKQDDGTVRYSAKLEALPLSHEWSGWVNAYPKEERQQPAQKSQNSYSQKDTAKPEFHDDDIAF